ncbi:MAG: nuclear transport factor 2 family protein [Bauldia sp.]
MSQLAAKRAPSPSSNRRTWLEGIGAIIDSMDAKAFAALITENGTFRFGNMAPIVGRPAIEKAVAAFWSTIAGSKHRVINFWEGPGTVVWEGAVLYTRKDGRQVPVNFANVFYMDGDLIRDYLIHIDNTPLYAP